MVDNRQLLEFEDSKSLAFGNSVRSSMFIATVMRSGELRQEFNVRPSRADISLLNGVRRSYTLVTINIALLAEGPDN
jgi:hypothetical protein